MNVTSEQGNANKKAQCRKIIVEKPNVYMEGSVQRLQIDGPSTEITCFIGMKKQSAIHGGPLSSLHNHSRKTLNKLTYTSSSLQRRKSKISTSKLLQINRPSLETKVSKSFSQNSEK
jgi:hypothetical protein